MPKINEHIQKSIEKTGKDFKEVHGFVDNAATKFHRHDITRIFEIGKYFEKTQGQEAVHEYIQHIHDDVKSKFEHLFEDLEKIVSSETLPKIQKLVWDTLRYFGIKQLSRKIDPSDIELMKNAGMTEADILHSIKVAQKALDIAARTDVELDMELVARGALFHDLGKSRTHDIEHGGIGAEIGAGLGLPATVTAIMEKHIRGGLTAEEAKELGLPVKDYTLKTLEERIIIYADRLVDIVMDGVAGDWEAEDRFEELIKTIPRYGKNDLTLQRYLGYHKEIQGLINQ
jgi:uncharacterized protein